MRRRPSRYWPLPEAVKGFYYFIRYFFAVLSAEIFPMGSLNGRFVTSPRPCTGNVRSPLPRANTYVYTVPVRLDLRQTINPVWPDPSAGAVSKESHSPRPSLIDLNGRDPGGSGGYILEQGRIKDIGHLKARLSKSETNKKKKKVIVYKFCGTERVLKPINRLPGL